MQTHYKQRFEIKITIPRNRPWDAEAHLEFEPKNNRNYIFPINTLNAISILEQNTGAATFFSCRFLGSLGKVAWRDQITTKTQASATSLAPGRQYVHEHMVFS